MRTCPHCQGKLAAQGRTRLEITDGGVLELLVFCCTGPSCSWYSFERPAVDSRTIPAHECCREGCRNPTEDSYSLCSHHEQARRQCICRPGDPCDWHAITCVVCYPRCQGHPVEET